MTHEENHGSKKNTDGGMSDQNIIVSPPLWPDEELFCRYYGIDTAPKRKHPSYSPWELVLAEQEFERDSPLK
jgi:hypothetical protein